MSPYLVAGLGFRLDVDIEAIRHALQSALQDLGLETLALIATLDRKAGSAALQAFCSQHGLALKAVPASQLIAWGEHHRPGPSAAERHLGLPGVAEPCALIAAGPGSRLLRPKYSLAGVSVALALPAP
ncbi:cobalamin biosynthesis protein [Frateuria aurantia]